MGNLTRRANDAAAFALCLCVYRHLSRIDAAYSPYCLEEEEFSEVHIRDRAYRRSYTARITMINPTR